jgi:hypothetical protein
VVAVVVEDVTEVVAVVVEDGRAACGEGVGAKV